MNGKGITSQKRRIKKHHLQTSHIYVKTSLFEGKIKSYSYDGHHNWKLTADQMKIEVDLEVIENGIEKEVDSIYQRYNISRNWQVFYTLRSRKNYFSWKYSFNVD